MNLESRIDKLEKQLINLQEAFLKNQQNQVPITRKTDTSFSKCPQVDSNTEGVEENDGAIMDVADLADENSNALEELAAIIDDLDARVTALEEGE